MKHKEMSEFSSKIKIHYSSTFIHIQTKFSNNQTKFSNIQTNLNSIFNIPLPPPKMKKSSVGLENLNMGVFGLERSHSPWLIFLHQRKIILNLLLAIEPVINSQWIINIGKIITKYVNLRRRWIINSNWLYSIDKPRRHRVAFTSNNLGRQCLYYFLLTIVHTLGVMNNPAPGLLALSRNLSRIEM